MYQKGLLDNGLRIISTPMPHARSVSIYLFIGAGSRYESEKETGISHFVEHLCFKGTDRKPTARDISETIEGVGGILNGGTDKELTVYWCKVARAHFPLAVDVLADMLRHSKFEPQDIESERRVIVEEINMSMDSPQHRADMLIDELLWPHQALGREVAGTKETVSGLSRQMLLDYLAHQYLPNNAVVSVAGDVDHGEVMESLNQALKDWEAGTPLSWYPAKDVQEKPQVHFEHRPTEQTHLCLAVKGLSAKHPNRFVLDLLGVILGEGMSSRLFAEIRDKRGLAYAIYSYIDHFLDSGAVTIYAGVDPKRTEAAIEAILEQVRLLKENSISEAELNKAKELTKGRLALRMEDTRNVANWVGGQELLLGRIRTPEEVASIIDAITTEDLQGVARELMVSKKLNLSLVGPIERGERLEGLLQL